MLARIHGGATHLGGSCVELECAGARVLLDVGLPLDAPYGSTPPLPPVAGLADGDDRSLLGVIISHGHPDHYGLVAAAAPSVPRYIGEAAHRILARARFFMLLWSRSRADGLPSRSPAVRARTVPDHALSLRSQRVRRLQSPRRGRRTTPFLLGRLQSARPQARRFRAAPNWSLRVQTRCSSRVPGSANEETGREGFRARSRSRRSRSSSSAARRESCLPPTPPRTSIGLSRSTERRGVPTGSWCSTCTARQSPPPRSTPRFRR